MLDFIPLIDLRSSADFLSRRPRHAASLPADEHLLGRLLFALPEKAVPLALLADQRETLDRIRAALKSWGWRIRYGLVVPSKSTSASKCTDKETCSSSLFSFESHVCFYDDEPLSREENARNAPNPVAWGCESAPPQVQPVLAEDLDKAAADTLFWQELMTAHGWQIVSSPLPETKLSTVNPPLFQPCPPLSEFLEMIEKTLTSSNSVTSSSSSSDSTKSTSTGAVLRCIDVGCGSGRDMIFLASRPKQYQWRVLGIDARQVMLQNVHRFAVWRDVHPWIQTMRARLTPNAGVRIWSGNNNEDEDKSEPVKDIGSDDNNKNDNKKKKTLASSSSTVHATLDEAVDALQGTYELVLAVRMLERGSFPLLAALVRPGGILLYHTFVDGDHPDLPSDDHTLKHGELARYFGTDGGFEVLIDRVESILDGRSMATYIARKRAISR